MGFILLNFCRTFQRVRTWNEKNHGREITAERHKNGCSKFTTESCLGRLKHSATIQLRDKGVRCVPKRVNGIKPNNRAGPSRYTCLIVTGGVQSLWLPQLTLSSAETATSHSVELPDWCFPLPMESSLTPGIQRKRLVLTLETNELFWA